MFHCLFYQSDKSFFSINCELVPRAGDFVEIDQRISGVVQKVCLSSNEDNLELNGEIFVNRFWTYHIHLAEDDFKKE